MRVKLVRWQSWVFAALGVLALLAGVQARAEDDFLDPEVAFKGSVRAQDAKTVEIIFDIAPGYYLYREQFKFAATGASIGAPVFPPGKVKFDETFQKNVETHRGLLRITVPVEQAKNPFRVAVNYQGCADKGLCYPPAQMRADVSLAGFGGDGTARVLPGREIPIPGASTDVSPPASMSVPATGAKASQESSVADEGDGIETVLRSGGFWKTVGVFFLAGIALSLTPCVLPMVPILSSIIVGQGGGTGQHRGRSFTLSVGYSLGMAVVYTALGVAAGLAGNGLAAYLQNPWVLGTFALMLVVLSLSMFGVYELQLPTRFTSSLNETSQRLPGGRFAGVFAMGGLSALIVSPCVAAPLAAALVFIGQTRDVVLGGTALFALSVGMSVPLLLVGASAGALLPKVGAWMNEVKRVFGLVLIGVALYVIQPVLPTSVAIALLGVLLLGAAYVVLGAGKRDGSSTGTGRKIAAALVGLVGVAQLGSGLAGGTDPLRPLSVFTPNKAAAERVASALPFETVRSVAELDAKLAQARSSNRVAMLDFYADWCVSCKEMEHLTFTDTKVAAKLANAMLLKADVTHNNADDRELLKRFQLFGPPGTIFFDAQGKELVRPRVIGFQNVEKFIDTLNKAGL
ncbi:protein-disulfide reductase DsbD [Piscinibacter terrae]|uniref:Thiol:disulfide interchange protein DsbD n=1 Tax=Piscinibacter terrae TaxID=2496871 RepID=A0A3N7HWI9_9BURK|nr:protein-disulfide reductase DsbD [Albitalea terrae]RQP26714.1 protein-disulfide reductase DsbD [Albitalea terrae]